MSARPRMALGALFAAALLGAALWMPGKYRAARHAGSATALCGVAGELTSDQSERPASTLADEKGPDGVSILGPGSIPSGGARPHPITAEHARIQHEVVLVSTLGDHFDAGDWAGVKRLLEEHRLAVPEDTDKIREGYAILLDCVERPGPEARNRAERFWDRERASTLRRRIRHLCFGEQSW